MGAVDTIRENYTNAPKVSKAKIRWHLAVLLLRNPLLQTRRKKRLYEDQVNPQEVPYQERMNILAQARAADATPDNTAITEIEMSDIGQGLTGWPLMRAHMTAGRLRRTQFPQDFPPGTYE